MNPSSPVAGKPDPVRECGVTNKTFTSIHVECTPGYDGGLQQSFVIEVFPVGAVDLGLEIGGADGGASLVSLEVGFVKCLGARALFTHFLPKNKVQYIQYLF